MMKKINLVLIIILTGISYFYGQSAVRNNADMTFDYSINSKSVKSNVPGVKLILDNKASFNLSQKDKEKLIKDMKERIISKIKKNWYKPWKVDDEIASELARAYKNGTLEPTIVAIFSDPRMQKMLPSDANYDPLEIARVFSMYIGAELESNGFVEGVKPVESWDDLTVRFIKVATASKFKPRGKGYTSLLMNPVFISELEKVQGKRFSDGNKIELLINGPASFSKRDEIMKHARKSIYLTTWAIYDDETGHHTADILIKKKKEGVDVRVIVDEDTARLYNKGILEKLKKEGIPVIRWQINSRPYYEFHSKILIVDRKEAILGGMNIGNEYSHMAGEARWRDTDIYVKGPAVKEGLKFFAEVWNQQIKEHNLAYKKLSPYTPDIESYGGSKATIVWNVPRGQQPIITSMLKAIYGATERINIENAIMVMFPALEKALIDALNRGVKVNIMSNSKTTIGDKIMSRMILDSFPRLIRKGAKVYLKRGNYNDRLHSKFMTVDGIFGTVGSFNLQPRSIRYVREISVNFIDPDVVYELDRAFMKDISEAKYARKVRDLERPFLPIKFLVRKYMFNQL